MRGGLRPPRAPQPGPSPRPLPKLPLPEHFLHKRPPYHTLAIPRPLTQITATQLGVEPQETKFSVTRSPSLEKDEKSPAVRAEVFQFDAGEMSERLSPGEERGSPGLRRYRSISTRLNVCSVEDQPSPKLLDMAERKFDFSPKLLADSVSSPRFFTPPETTPVYFAEPSPKSVYYDSVRSPKFFPETPREDLPQSPRTLSDHLNRNIDKPSSPKVLSARPSPKVHSCNKENYFTFDAVCLEEGAARISPRPKRYGGRNSIEKERFTPPADREVRKYRRHNSCDTNYRNVELNITNGEDNKETKVDADVVDCCAKMEAMDLSAREDVNDTSNELSLAHSSAHLRRQRLKSISLDSENAKIIEQNLGLPIAKQMKEQMNEAYKNHDVSASCESMERNPKSPPKETPVLMFEEEQKDKTEDEEPKTPDLVQKKCLRHAGAAQTFIDMPRFSPKEFEIIVTNEDGTTTSAETQTKRKGKNLRNLTIDLNKRDSELEKELEEFEKLFSQSEETKTKTPTLKVKATSLDSSESVNLSLPQQKTTLDVPQNSISVPNTPKRQIKRILAQKSMKEKGAFSLLTSADHRRLYMKGQDSGIFLKENHANLMLYQPSTSRMTSRTMGSFDENITDLELTPEVTVSGSDRYGAEPGQTLGSNLLTYKQSLSVSSTNLKTLPEGVPSDDFEPSAEDEKLSKKLHRRNSQSVLHSSHSLQSSNCSINSSGASCHNLAGTVRSVSNFSLSSETRQKRMSIDRRDSNSSMTAEHLTPSTRITCASNTNVSGESKNCLLQRRGSNNSLSLNISCELSRHASNSSLNKEARPAHKKGLLERRSSNTSLTLNINSSNPQLSTNRALSISNYNLNGSTSNLSTYNSNHSIDNPVVEQRKESILERRSSNTSLTLNIQPQEPRDIEIDERMIKTNFPSRDIPPRDKHRKSLSTENLIPKASKTRIKVETEKCGYGSHDSLWSSYYSEEPAYPQNLTYVGGDQENEMIYAFGQQEPAVPIKNITTKPLSPQTTSEDFKVYLANMQHLQIASSVLSRQQLRDLNEVFQNGYSTVKCSQEDGHICCARIETSENEISSQACSEYQKKLMRNLHQEFWDMPTNFQEKPIVSGSHPKNRYRTILPNEHSRLILKSDEVADGEGYINANYIKGHEYTRNSYIATQGPLQNTIYDFWLMVHQNCLQHRRSPERPQSRTDPGTSQTPDPDLDIPIQKVVMLTNFVENNRQKCEKYFPTELNEELEFHSPEYTDSKGFFEDTDVFRNSFVIKNLGILKRSGYTIRKLEASYRRKVNTQCDSECDSDTSVTVYHYWFHNWADHTCPKDVNALLNLSLDVLKDSPLDFSGSDEDQVLCTCNDTPKPDSKFIFPPLEAQNVPCEVTVKISTPVDFSVETTSPPMIVHCSAGIGRTGCLIAILNGIKQLTNEQKVDILGIVCNMRLNRGGMVQNSEQYELIHKVLCVYEQACLPAL